MPGAASSVDQNPSGAVMGRSIAFTPDYATGAERAQGRFRDEAAQTIR